MLLYGVWICISFSIYMQITGHTWQSMRSHYLRVLQKKKHADIFLKASTWKGFVGKWLRFFSFCTLGFQKKNKIKNIDHVGFVFKIQVNKNFDFKFDQWGIVKYLFVVHVKPTIKMKLRKNMYQMVLCFHSHRWEEKYQERRKWWSIYT